MSDSVLILIARICTIPSGIILLYYGGYQIGIKKRYKYLTTPNIDKKYSEKIVTYICNNVGVFSFLIGVFLCFSAKMVLDDGLLFVIVLMVLCHLMLLGNLLIPYICKKKGL